MIGVAFFLFGLAALIGLLGAGLPFVLLFGAVAMIAASLD